MAVRSSSPPFSLGAARCQCRANSLSTGALMAYRVFGIRLRRVFYVLLLEGMAKGAWIPRMPGAGTARALTWVNKNGCHVRYDLA